ncbi:ribokinase (plasmid) [Rhizobium rosettiformans]|uniref:Ribokinase n=2 Tax=Rhizobium/Agrobacterium group TaxID=227290 RepID=A0ABX7F393_9HYPH|nr:ribokinase [Rhizobium rosettiformans]
MSHASKCRPLKSSFDWRFNFSAMAFRIMATLRYTRSGISPVVVNSELTKKICDKPIENQNGDRVFVGANLSVSIIAPRATDLARLQDFDAIHTGRSSHVDAWLPHFSKATKVSYDFATVHDAKRIAQVAPHCFLLAFSGGSLSRHEALSLAGLAHAHGATWSLVTRGQEGALLFGPHGFHEEPAQAVEAIDTLGAGDTFIAYVLVGLLEERQSGDVLSGAAQAAAKTCLMRGAFGHGAPMAIDLSNMMSLEEIYRITKPAAVPAEA